MPSLIRRRQLIAATLRVPLAWFAASAGLGLRKVFAAEPGSPALELRQIATLERIAYLLFPYPELGSAPYQRVVAGMQQDLAAQPPQLALATTGLADLDHRSGGDWLELPEEGQLEQLHAIEQGGFFAWALQSTQSRLFHDVEVWQLLGYEGSSVEFGGYRERGLDDIDWVPRSAEDD